MPIQNEIWKPEIIEGIYKDNAFLMRAYNADEYVVGGSAVHIPQAGGGSAVQRNRSVYPATATRRTDTDIIYTLHEYTTDPRHIPNRDTVELSYEKRQSIIREETAFIKERVAEDFIYDWAFNVPVANVILTTGATSATAVPTGGTGTRKILTEADFRRARTMLGNHSVGKAGRVAVITEEMLDQLQSDNNLKYAFQQVIDLKEGSVGRLYGFDIYTRATVGSQTTGGTAGVPKLPEAAAAATDDAFALFYQEDCVERALGDVRMFERLDDPLYYGDIYSFLVRARGRNRRADNKGIVKVVAAP
jgi:Phage capsid protein